MSRESIYKRYIPAVTFEPESAASGRWFVFCLNKLLVKTSGDRAEIPCVKSLEEINLSPAGIQYLGTLEGESCFSADVPPDTAIPPGMSFQDLRPLYGILDEDLFLLAGRALQIVSWEQTHRYCGRCGLKTETLEGERAKKCPACGLICYPRLSPAAITAVIKGNEILLSHNVAFRGNVHSLIAGFVEPGETLEDCVRREILEEAGIRVKNIRYFGSQPWPFPNSLMIGFTAEYESGEIKVDGKEISKAGWFDVNSLPDLPGKMSIAREIIDWFTERQKTS